VALVRRDAAQEAAGSILSLYTDKTGRTGRAWTSHPADGAGPAAC
jgi:hypothetical protein